MSFAELVLKYSQKLLGEEYIHAAKNTGFWTIERFFQVNPSQVGKAPDRTRDTRSHFL